MPLIKPKTYFLSLILICTTIGCKKSVEVDPPIDKPDASVIYASDALATAVLTGMYNRMSSGSFATGNNSISVRAGLSADEFSAYSSSGSEALSYYRNDIAPTTTRFWSEIYNYLYITNSAIEGVTNSTKLNAHVRDQLLGEAKFMRAFLHFYLVNLFADIPLSLSTDFGVNSIGVRIPKVDIYKQIVQDLIEAKELLSDNFSDLDLKGTTIERVRPHKGAATALLARVYLYVGDYGNAELQSTLLLNNKQLYDTVSLNQVFLKNSKESIWQLQPTAPNFNTPDGRAFILTSAPGAAQPVSISTQLLSVFESGDNRRTNWIKSDTFNGTVYHSPFKYKVQSGSDLTEYLVVLRLAEQYLIRAEARSKLNKVAEALEDLNVIRNRAGLPDTVAADQQALLALIEHERQIELFSEWGHRWLDLKRTNRVDAIMSVATPQKGGSWQSYKQLYPIPQGDIDKSKALTQNAGY